ncbi:unnamed protein product [Sphagnum troendelagicum]
MIIHWNEALNSVSVEQAATILLSTPIAAIGETPLLSSPPHDVEIPNEGFQTGDLYEDIQEGSMSGQMTSTSGTLSNFHALPFSWDQAATEFMDLDDGEVPATLFERLQHDQLGDIGDRVASVEATLMEGCNPVDQAATEFLDLDDGEDLATLFERPQHDQLGDIGDGVASDEATLMEGCNPDINDM